MTDSTKQPIDWKELRFDPARVNDRAVMLTGVIVVAANINGDEVTSDLAYLDTPSLAKWLEAHRGVGVAENIVARLLRHGVLHPEHERYYEVFTEEETNARARAMPACTGAGCSRCRGSFCSNHGTEGCDCGVIARHR